MINKKEGILYICIFALFLAAYLMADSFPAAAATYPKAICMLGMFLDMVLILARIIKDSNIKKDEKELKRLKEEYVESALKPEQIKRICIFMGLLLIYIFCIKKLGYFVSTITYLVISMAVYNEKLNWKMFTISIMFVTALYFVFNNLLHILIPHGILY